MRVFLGFPAPPEIREYVERLQATLRRYGLSGKWVAPPSLHWTVLFLGEQDAPLLDALGERLRQGVCGVPPFNLAPDGIGSFGRPPRLLFVGWQDAPRGAFARLTEQARLAAIGAGVLLQDRDLEDDPVAHLTFVRFRGSRETAALRELGRQAGGRWTWSVGVPEAPVAPVRVGRLVLYQSILSAHGPEYRELAEFALGTAAGATAGDTPA